MQSRGLQWRFLTMPRRSDAPAPPFEVVHILAHPGPEDLFACRVVQDHSLWKIGKCEKGCAVQAAENMSLECGVPLELRIVWPGAGDLEETMKRLLCPRRVSLPPQACDCGGGQP